MLKNLKAGLILTGATLLICCVLDPALLYAVGRGLFPTASSGGMVDGTGEATKDSAAGARLIAQPFTNDEYFWPRPSAAGYNGAAAGGSNWGANNPKLRDRVAQQLGPIVVYRAGSPSAGPDKANPRTPQQDIEAWFAAVPDRAATWAADTSVGPANWAKTDFADDKYGLPGRYVADWAKAHPKAIADWKKANPDKTDEPKPEDLVGPFFADFAKANPGKWPGVVEVEQPDKTKLKRVEPVASDAAIHSNFFDLWLSDPANVAKSADLEPVVADMVTASGSGLDPHITARNALSVYQLDRIARKRGVSPSNFEKVKEGIAALVSEKAYTPLFGLVGEALTNVLELNMELDKRFPLPGTN